MSRLDDELRRAFRREQPSANFTARLLERAAQQPSPKAPWWRRAAMLLDPPTLRWVAIGAAASLLLAIGVAQYSRLHRAAVDDQGKIATNDPAPQASGAGSVTPKGDENSAREVAQTAPEPAQPIKRAAGSSTNHRLARATSQQDRGPQAEGEAAKEKLMLALAIASSALNDAQKAVHDDGFKP